MVKQITAALLQMEGHMHTRATRSQFEIKDTVVIHTPTGAEFISQSGDSVLVWTGDIGQKLPSGDVYRAIDEMGISFHVLPRAVVAACYSLPVRAARITPRDALSQQVYLSSYPQGAR